MKGVVFHSKFDRTEVTDSTASQKRSGFKDPYHSCAIPLHQYDLGVLQSTDQVVV